MIISPMIELMYLLDVCVCVCVYVSSFRDVLLSSAQRIALQLFI